MPYVTSIEQMAKAEGKAEGRLEGQRAIALNMLRRAVPVETVAELTELSIEQIRQLQSQLQSPE